MAHNCYSWKSKYHDYSIHYAFTDYDDVDEIWHDNTITHVNMMITPLETNLDL